MVHEILPIPIKNRASKNSIEGFVAAAHEYQTELLGNLFLGVVNFRGRECGSRWKQNWYQNATGRDKQWDRCEWRPDNSTQTK